MTVTKAGYVALLGRPNVGKSTLLNRLIEQKISITSPKPQTTRHRILGIKTLAETQIVYVDTPGLHRNAKKAINRYMNRTASATLSYVDVAVLLIEALHWTAEDQLVVQYLQEFSGPLLLVVNKIDRIKDKQQLLPFLQQVKAYHDFDQIVPLSALYGDNLAVMETLIRQQLPQSPHYFSADQITTASQRFLAAELVREKLTRILREELPYALTVEIERFEQHNKILHINAIIWVERAGQKAIVIGSNGATLKKAGQQARESMERLFASKVFLETWVKVRSGWSNDERALESFGYRLDN